MFGDRIDEDSEAVTAGGRLRHWHLMIASAKLRPFLQENVKAEREDGGRDFTIPENLIEPLLILGDAGEPQTAAELAAQLYERPRLMRSRLKRFAGKKGRHLLSRDGYLWSLTPAGEILAYRLLCAADEYWEDVCVPAMILDEMEQQFKHINHADFLPQGGMVDDDDVAEE